VGEAGVADGRARIQASIQAWIGAARQTVEREEAGAPCDDDDEHAHANQRASLRVIST